MRWLTKYPITQEEKINLLNKYLSDPNLGKNKDGEILFGNLDAVILQEIIKDEQNLNDHKS